MVCTMMVDRVRIPKWRDRVSVVGHVGVFRVIRVDEHHESADLARVDQVGFLADVDWELLLPEEAGGIMRDQLPGTRTALDQRQGPRRDDYRV